MRLVSLVLTGLLLTTLATPLVSAGPGGPEPRPCEPQTISGGVVDVGLKMNCGVHVEVLPDLICVTGTGSVEEDVDRHSVHVNYCRVPVDAAASVGCPVSSKPGTIGGIAETYPRGERGSNSCVNVDVKFMDCVWNGSWKTITETSAARVRVYTCDGGNTA